MRGVSSVLVYEADIAFQRGDFPLTVQMSRFIMGIDPTDEDTVTNLIMMLRSIDDDAGALALAIRFREENPQNPNRGLAEAQLYWLWRQYARIPKILQPDIMRAPSPHQNTFRMLGHSFGRMGFESEALKVWEQAIKVFPGDPAFELLRDKSKRKLGL